MRALSLCMMLAVPAILAAETTPQTSPDSARPAVRAVALRESIRLDGRLDESVWRTAPVATGFSQNEPDEGQPATQRTEVRFAYDGEALYVGARMYDERGAAGVSTRLTRRDGDLSSDYLGLIFDTQHDHLGRTMFTVNPSGVKQDAYGPGGTGPDESWDPVWEVATAIDSLGWTAEIRIPFSQLRFTRGPDRTWGLQMWRGVNRLNETDMWSFWRQNEVGGPPLFGHLEGLDIEASPERAEVLPYVVGRSSYVRPEDAGDPFARPAFQDFRVGLDARYLLTPNLSLDATVNPDFGQVEVDPAVVNLSAFETYFEEKRPFFIEGRGLFSFGSFNCFFCSNVSSMNLFYSRRIGRSPQGADAAYDAGEYADVPENTAILGAAKVTGRTESGWSIGALEAVTSRETAHVLTEAGERLSQEVEPVSNYAVARLRRDLLGGNLVLGGIATSVYRGIRSDALAAELPRHAETGGIDWAYWWHDHTYRFMGNLAVTNVVGSPAAILLRQESSAHYFQRPDRKAGGNGLFSDAYDPSATVLRGYGGYARLAKDGGNWRWETSVNFRSPGFEANDLAFASRADYVWMNANLNRQFTTPTRWYRRFDFIVGGQQQLNYDGDVTSRDLQAWVGTQTPFYWWATAFIIHRPSHLDDQMTRGGPVVRRPTSDYASASLQSDDRRPVYLSLDVGHGWVDGVPSSVDANVYVTVKPLSNVQLSVGPSYSSELWPYQWVTSEDDATAAAFFGTRYVFADIDQKTVSMDTRVNVIFSPTMSLELFAQPLISAARYSRFKEFAAPRSLATRVYGVDAGDIRLEDTADGRVYTVDPDGAGPAASFEFDDPDFNFRSLRGNAVFRWEYLPGSTLYVVWTQSRSGSASYGDFSLGRDQRALFSSRPDNILLVKLSYWLGI